MADASQAYGDLDVSAGNGPDRLGAIVLSTGGVERARINADGSGSGWETVLGGFLPPAGPAALVGKLKSGVEPAVIWVCGDSTGDDQLDWTYEILGKLAAKFPAYTVTSLPWSDALQAFDSNLTAITPTIQTGTAGDAYYTNAALKHLSTPDSAALSTTGDLDIRIKCRAADWTPAAAQSLVTKFGAAGQRSWRFFIASGGSLTLETTADGTTQLTSTSSAGLTLTDGQTYWLRATLDVDNGASGHTVTFYTSTDGLTWTQLGSAVTTAGVTSIFDSTTAVMIGTRLTSDDAFLGDIFYVEVRSGIGSAGAPIVLLDVDDYNPAAPTAITDRVGNVWTVAGAPTFSGSPGLVFVNCCVEGTILSYASDGTRFPKMTVGRPADLSFIDYGHNDTATDYRTPYKALADLLLTKWTATNIVAVTQNPEKSPRAALQIANQLSKMAQIAALAAQQHYALLDGLRAFLNQQDYTTWLEATGVHPTQAGYDLWAQYGYDHLFKQAVEATT